MKTYNEFTPVMIECDKCNTVQAAIVEHTRVWNTHDHHCVSCQNIITESEWKEIKPFIKL